MRAEAPLLSGRSGLGTGGTGVVASSLSDSDSPVSDWVDGAGAGGGGGALLPAGSVGPDGCCRGL